MIIALIVITWLVLGILTVRWCNRSPHIESLDDRVTSIGFALIWPITFVIASFMWLTDERDNGSPSRVGKVLDFVLGLR